MKLKLTLIFLLLTSVGGYGQTYDMNQAQTPEGKTIVFRFVADDDMFYILWQGNGKKLAELVATIDYYKSAITAGQAKINVEGYSSGLATRAENIKSAAIRANRVKSELITRCGIREENFHTTVYATPYEGWKSVVVVTLRVPQISEPVKAGPAPKPEPRPEVKPEPKPEPEPVVVEEQTVVVFNPPLIEQPAKPYRVAVRTNLLYDAMLLPTLGVEWSISDRWGVKLDGSRSWWGDEHGKVQKIWMLSPEVRYYMGDACRWYAGVSGNFGKYNIYKGMSGNLISKDTGYQGSMWNVGIVAGYRLPLNKCLSLDFNLGLGYSRFEYDSFNVINQTRVYKDKDRTKNLFGPTQAGVSLVWTIAK